MVGQVDFRVDKQFESETKRNTFLCFQGHQIKNEKTVKAKNLRSIPARHRLIVSGTPVQNNLQVSALNLGEVVRKQTVQLRLRYSVTRQTDWDRRYAVSSNATKDTAARNALGLLH
jgi:hypothetical protein